MFGVPLDKMELKIGVSIKLLRNLNDPKLCKGTGLGVISLGPNLIGATTLLGPAGAFHKSAVSI